MSGKVMTEEEVAALLGPEKLAELARSRQLSEELAEKNISVIKSAEIFGSTVLIGLAEGDAPKILEQIRELSEQQIDLDESFRFSRGKVQMDGYQVEWSLDRLDDATKRAMIASDFFCLQLKRV